MEERERAEEGMLREDVVRELLAGLDRGEGIKTVAREPGVDRKTVRRWRQQGGWRPQTRSGGGDSKGDGPWPKAPPSTKRSECA